MKRFSRLAFCILWFSGMFNFSGLRAQIIFEPEGLNIPGTWNDFVNPPAAGSAFGSEFQVNQGGVKLITTGTRRWQTGFLCNNSSGIPSGPHTFLFTSGPSASAFNNKWCGTAVNVNQIQNYTFNASTDNSIVLDSNFYYTINWRDAGYANTQAVVMKTTSEPVTLDSLYTSIQNGQVLPNEEVLATLILGSVPSPEERFYLRYSFDSFAGSFVIPMTVNGNVATASLPGFQAGTEVDFYAFSTTIQNPTVNYDLITLQFINNNGLNYSYSVLNKATLLNLGPDFAVCAGSGPWDLAVSSAFDSYLWSTGSTDSAIVISTPGTYSVQVTLGGVSVSDTITVSLVEPPVFNLGDDISYCNTSPLLLNSGVFSGPSGDIITIIYDATQGQTQLANLDTTLDRVYMHSGYEEVPFGGAVNWIGNWGEDDDLGAMTYLGNNRWSITFNIFDYYGISDNNSISGLFMVFRNSDGTLTGKDDNGDDIFLSLQQNPPASSFSGIEATIQGSGIQSLVWSNGAETSSIEVSESGTYSATATNLQGCTFTDSIVVTLLDVPVLTVSNDTTICEGVFDIPLQAFGNFESFAWSTGETTSTISVNSQDAYVVTATAANGCLRSDTVNVSVSLFPYSSVLNDSYLSCGGALVSLITGLSLSPQGDSLTIVYDATQGQSQLQGATSVYMHSTFEFAPFAGGFEPWVGNWGQDDGVGEMTSIGNNLWSITINVYDYYGVPLDSAVNGLFMVFRNADGTLTGKDDAGNDIFLNLSTPVPTSAFAGVTATVEQSDVVAINWSDGSSNAILTTNQAGIYTVSILADNGCLLNDTTQVLAVPDAQVSLGADRILCTGETATLNAGSGFSSYQWSSGSTQSSISVSSSGTYSVTATTIEGCVAQDSVSVQVIDAPNANFSIGAIQDSLVSFIDLSSGPANYAWDFESDGITDVALSGNVNYVYTQSGNYIVTLILTNFCGADTASANVSVTITGLEGIAGGENKIIVFPNPAHTNLTIPSTDGSVTRYELYSASGQLVSSGSCTGALNMIDVSAMASGLYSLRLYGSNRLMGHATFVKD